MTEMQSADFSGKWNDLLIEADNFAILDRQSNNPSGLRSVINPSFIIKKGSLCRLIKKPGAHVSG